jgi:ankyrin repeat protein
VNFRNSKGMTALHFLLRKRSDRKHIAMLLGYGADPTIRNAEGESPLDMVAHRRDQALRDLFSQRGPSRRTGGKAR